MSDLTSTLPKPVAVYLAAENAKDVDTLAQCFAADARVFDESHDYRGLDAILAWKRETNEKYKYVAEPLDATIDGNVVKLCVRLTGQFPGSPVEVDYTFTLENDRISSLGLTRRTKSQVLRTYCENRARDDSHSVRHRTQRGTQRSSAEQ